FVRAAEPDADDSRPRHARLWLSRRTDEARRCLKSSIPFLTRVVTNNFVRPGEFPFTLPFLKGGLDLQLENFVTFFAGENGSGKSTLLEAIAERCGFNPAGGNRNHSYTRHETESGLSSAIQLIWRKRIGQDEGIYLLDEPEAALSRTAVGFSADTLRSTGIQAWPVYRRHAFADYSRFPRRKGALVRRERAPGNSVSGDRALPHHARVS